MVHTNHFIHGQCTGMNVIQRCLSHPHELWRCDKHLFSVCWPGLLSWRVRLTMSNIHNAQSFSMDDSLTDGNSSPPDSEAHIHAVIDAVCAGTSFRQAGKQYGIPHTTISNRFHGHKPPSFAHERQQLLTNVQKTVII